MFKNLLVPLDGSPMAESALPAAEYLAEKLGAHVTLMHCIERDAPKKVHGERHLSMPEEARAYLHEVAHRAFPAHPESLTAGPGATEGPGAQIACHTHETAIANVARSIVEHAQGMPSPLIVMCAHGRGALGKLLMGSIAQRIIGLGATPVLLIPPAAAERKPDVPDAKSQSSAQTFACRRLLVPLDGRKPHEEALTAAGDLARACGAAIHLLFVVATRRSLPNTDAVVGLLLPRATHAVLEIARQEAEEYLGCHAGRLRAGGCTVRTEVQRGAAPKAILAAAEREAADLIIMATHRKRAMGAFWAGSVAPRVASYTGRPLLLLPIS